MGSESLWKACAPSICCEMSGAFGPRPHDAEPIQGAFLCDGVFAALKVQRGFREGELKVFEHPVFAHILAVLGLQELVHAEFLKQSQLGGDMPVGKGALDVKAVFGLRGAGWRNCAKRRSA